MTVGELLAYLVVREQDAKVVFADSPFLDGQMFDVALVTEDENGDVVLSPDVLLSLRQPDESAQVKGEA